MGLNMNDITYGTVKTAGLRYGKTKPTGMKIVTKVMLATATTLAIVTLVNPAISGSILFVGLCGYLAMRFGKLHTI